MKTLIKIVFCVVVVAVAAVLSLPFWIGPVVRIVANSAVPAVTKVDFNLGELTLNPYVARFSFGDLRLGNPEGFAGKDAVRVGTVALDAETLSLMTDVIHVEEITFRDLFVSIENGGPERVTNFKQIQYNMAGGKEKYEATQSEKAALRRVKEGKAEQKVAKQESAEKPAEGKSAASEWLEKKVIIDRLEISGLTLSLAGLPIKVPSIVLTDIGRKEGGATFEEVWRQISDDVMKSAGVSADQRKALEKFNGKVEESGKVLESATKAVESAGKALDSLKKLW